MVGVHILQIPGPFVAMRAAGISLARISVPFFAVALFIGILVGTYSSIFVASPVVLSLRITRDDMLVIKKEGEEADSLP